MASKAKALQVKDKEKDDKAADAPEKDSAEAPSPLLDLSDAAVKKMIKQAKKRGFVTFDQLNEVLPSDTTSPEQIEDIMSMLSDMGINVTEAEEDSDDDKQEDAADDETDNELVEVTSIEFDILEVLARSAGRTVTRDELTAVLYQRRATPYERSLDVHISHLRKKLERDERSLIRIIRGVGYQFAP